MPRPSEIILSLSPKPNVPKTGTSHISLLTISFQPYPNDDLRCSASILDAHLFSFIISGGPMSADKSVFQIPKTS